MKLNSYLPKGKKLTLIFSYQDEDIWAVYVDSKWELIFGHALKVIHALFERNGIDKKSTGLEMIDVAFNLWANKSDIDAIINHHPIFSEIKVKITELD